MLQTGQKVGDMTITPLNSDQGKFDFAVGNLCI